MRTEQDWLEDRRYCIGASDVAAILGENPHKGRFQVWAEKVLGYTQDSKDLLIYGKLAERPAAKIYELKTNRFVEKTEELERTIQYHPEIPWLGCTLDGMTAGSEETPAPVKDDKLAPLEVKNTSGFVWRDNRWKKIKPNEWAENPPLICRIQLQTQMACTGASWGSLTALFAPGIELVWHDETRNERLLNAVYVELEKFWRTVETRTPPSVDDLPSSLNIVKTLYPEDTGEIITLDDDTDSLAREWLEIKEQSSALKKRKDFLEAQIRLKMGEATFGKLPDNTYLSLKKTVTKGYTKIVEPGSFRTLRHTRKI